MKYFTKIDKEVITISLILIIVIVLIGFIAYRYTTGSVVDIKNSTGGIQTEQN